MAAVSFPPGSLLMATTQQQLDEVNTAISAITTGGQSHTIGIRTYTAGDLRTLFAERARLEKKLVAENFATNGGGLGYLVPE